MSNQCFITRRGGGSFTKSVIIATGPAGSVVKCQQLLRSANLVKSAEYPEASAQDASCVTLKQCDSVSKSDRVQITLDVTASTETKGYWAPESGLISEKREIALKSGKQTIKLDVVSAGALSLDTKFFCKSGSDEATITAENLQIKKITQGKEKIVSEKNGTWTYRNIEIGLWAIQASLEDQKSTNEIEVPEFGVYRVTIEYRQTPDFTFTGEYEVIDDDDQPISDFANWRDNWKIRFLTSGTFTVTNMYGWNGELDVFLVGGGGGSGGSGSGSTNQISGTGGGGGYTKTIKKIKVNLNQQYEVVIGSGGSAGIGEGNAPSGGITSAFDSQVNGGVGGSGRYGTGKGGDGGSGGGGGGAGSSPGGTDGSDGSGSNPGKGQGTTTKEFEEESGTVYSNGGPSGSKKAGNVNTGNGAGGAAMHGGDGASGGSGIVVIRNAREAV